MIRVLKQLSCFILLLFVLSSCTKDEQSSLMDSTYSAIINTDLGNITVKLYDATPLHRNNFIKLANEKFYEGILFHRVIADFIIQAGDPDSKNATQGDLLGNGDIGYDIKAEIASGLTHKRGVLAAARLPNEYNPERKSSASQFYLTLEPADFLDGEYTIFGEIVTGFEIMDAIGEVDTDENARPIKDIAIRSITIKRN